MVYIQAILSKFWTPPSFLFLGETLCSAAQSRKRKQKSSAEFTKQEEWVKEHVPQWFMSHLTSYHLEQVVKMKVSGGETSFTSSSDDSYASKFKSQALLECEAILETPSNLGT